MAILLQYKSVVLVGTSFLSKVIKEGTCLYSFNINR